MLNKKHTIQFLKIIIGIMIFYSILFIGLCEFLINEIHGHLNVFNWSLDSSIVKTHYQLFQLVVLPYILGSIPFGYILTKAANLGDIRSIGSGNIGATNVLRTGNKKLALFTLLGDMLKGSLIVVIALASGYQYDSFFVTVAMFMGLVGHMYPLWLNFKGGKGVATYLGVLLVFCPLLGVTVFIIWLLIAKVFKYSSLGALISTFLTPFIFYGFCKFNLISMPTYSDLNLKQTLCMLAAMSLLVWWRHHENIQRLLKGTESKIGQK